MQGRLLQFILSALIIGGGGVLIWSAASALGSGELVLKSEFSTIHRADNPAVFWIALVALSLFGLGTVIIGIILLLTDPTSKDSGDASNK